MDKVVPGKRPEIVKASLLPAGFGAGGFTTAVAASKLPH